MGTKFVLNLGLHRFRECRVPPYRGKDLICFTTTRISYIIPTIGGTHLSSRRILCYYPFMKLSRILTYAAYVLFAVQVIMSIVYLTAVFRVKADPAAGSALIGTLLKPLVAGTAAIFAIIFVTFLVSRIKKSSDVLLPFHAYIFCGAGVLLPALDFFFTFVIMMR